MVAAGAEIGFADPRTISSKARAAAARRDHQHEPRYPYPPGAIQEFKPTVLAGVPKVWDIFKKGVEDKIGKGSPVVRFLFDVAFAARAGGTPGREAPLFKAVPFKKIAAIAGRPPPSSASPAAARARPTCRRSCAPRSRCRAHRPALRAHRTVRVLRGRRACCAGAVQFPQRASSARRSRRCACG